MFLITSTTTAIILCLNGDRVASIPKEDVEDFTTAKLDRNGLIDFKTKSGKQVRFAVPYGDQFDKAIGDLIKITDGMGI
tara:strand:+ start:1418 stop:1654 length:237 start_codon:yes stop_codon:yes gene_type:complete